MNIPNESYVENLHAKSEAAQESYDKARKSFTAWLALAAILSLAMCAVVLYHAFLSEDAQEARKTPPNPSFEQSRGQSEIREIRQVDGRLVFVSF